MAQNSVATPWLLYSTTFGMLLSGATPLLAQTTPVAAPAAGASAPASDAGDIQSIVVTGTRRVGVTAPESSTPIDVVGGEKLLQQGSSDLNDSLRTSIPSLNVQRFSAQAYSSVVRPFTLRGLSPDETLVLVNGKRRHRSAAIQLSRLPLASGSQGPDLSTIPTIAIDRVEVLRDGAAAQYGSDAIAGVINFQLKRADHGGQAVIRYGEFSKGDGEDTTLQGNIGRPLGDGGFVNLSAELTRAKPTYRAIQRPDAARLVAAGNTSIGDPVQPWGNTDSKGGRLFVNAELPLANATAYAFANYADTRADATQFWRDPTPTGSRSDIFASVPLTANAGGPRFSFASVYPGGILPVQHYKVTDASLTGGVKGSLLRDIAYDLSASLADSKMRLGVYNTVNPSLGPNAQSSYDVGNQSQREQQLHADFVYEWDNGFFAKPLNVAFGAEYRNEIFALNAGEPGSYIAGPYARVFDPDANRFIGLAAGASGFVGVQPVSAGQWSRSNWATYLDLETLVTRRWTVGLAGRYEKFSDFGDTFNYKVSNRFELSDAFALRGSFNTGFRAPTPGQQHISTLSSTINQQTGGLLLAATLPVDNPISAYYGAKPLKPEKSKNYSLGGVLMLADDFLATVDYFHINVTDRIGVTSPITVTTADAAALAARGIALNGTQTAAFFANAFSTTTKGIDAVVSDRLHVGGTTYDLSAAANYTKTAPYDITDPRAVDRQRMIGLASFNPRWRGNLQATAAKGPFSGLVRFNYYGKWTDAVAALSATAFDQDHGARWLTDIEASYELTKAIKLSIGAQNLFDIYPEKERLPANLANGMQYPQHTPFGYNGRFVYARASATF